MNLFFWTRAVLMRFSLILTHNKTEEALYSYWRFRVMFSIIIGYAAFYFVRQNLSFAMPEMQKALGFSKAQLGLTVTSFSLIYGIGKTISGYLGDKSSARFFMTIGLLLSAAVNLLMGMTTTLALFVIFWSMNACFQSMGAPSCAKVLTHWYGPKELGTRWAIWSASQQIGSAIIGLAAAYFVSSLGWQSAFYIPAAVCIAIAGIIFWGIRDEPKLVRLTNLEEYEGLSHIEEDECANMSTFQIMLKKVLCNKTVWIMCIANFFLYLVRTGIFTWAPMFLCEAKNNSFQLAGYQTAAFNIAGIIGGILAGILSDKVFEGRRGRVAVLFMIGLTISIFTLWIVPSNMPVFHTIIMFIIGFCVAGPQTMVGVASVDFASKKAAGSASGLTGTFGYLGSAISGSGIGYLAEKGFGWNGVFILMLVASFLGALCLALTWNARSKTLDDIKKKEEELDFEEAA